MIRNRVNLKEGDSVSRFGRLMVVVIIIFTFQRCQIDFTDDFGWVERPERLKWRYLNLYQHGCNCFCESGPEDGAC